MKRRWLAVLRGGAALVLIAAALASPGFFSEAGMVSLLISSSFIGCITIGMTLITLSGNIMSFCLGATAAASTMIFVAASNWGGLAFAVPATLLFGAVVTGIQGVVIGSVRANPIIVSIATLALIEGIAEGVMQGQSLYFADPVGFQALRGKILGIPGEFVVFVAVLAAGQFILSLTAFGRHIYLVGDSARAATALGVRVWRTVGFVYFWAGIFTAAAGILLALRYGGGNMGYGAGYDYDAIAAVLVGGTAIQGGRGAAWRSFVGVLVIAVVQMILLLNGFRDEWQYFIAGLIVLGAIMLQTRLVRGGAA